MITDLLLAIAHHFLFFGLAAALVAEAVLVRPGLGRDELKRLSRIDAVYGVLAVGLIAVGISRVFWGLKGWDYYAGNHAFWGKMAAFVAVALLSAVPTLRILRWRRAAAASADYTVPDAEIRPLRLYMHAQLTLFLVILAFAAMMARGIGS